MRPVLVVSVNRFNQGPSRLVIVAPITSTIRQVFSHIPIEPPEGGLKNRSAALCEAIRSISSERLVRRWGPVTDETMTRVEDILRVLIGL